MLIACSRSFPARLIPCSRCGVPAVKRRGRKPEQAADLAAILKLRATPTPRRAARRRSSLPRLSAAPTGAPALAGAAARHGRLLLRARARQSASRAPPGAPPRAPGALALPAARAGPPNHTPSSTSQGADASAAWRPTSPATRASDWSTGSAPAVNAVRSRLTWRAASSATLGTRTSLHTRCSP